MADQQEASVNPPHPEETSPASSDGVVPASSGPNQQAVCVAGMVVRRYSCSARVADSFRGGARSGDCCFGDVGVSYSWSHCRNSSLWDFRAFRAARVVSNRLLNKFEIWRRTLKV